MQGQLAPMKMKKRAITARERRILRKRVAGKSMGQIAKEMSTSKTRVFLVLKRLEPELQEALRSAGYGLNEAVTKMKEMADAKRTVFFQNAGIVTDKRVVADNQIRFAARREMLRVHGVGETMTVEHSGAILHVMTETDKREAEESLKRIEAFDSANEPALLAEVVGG